MDSRSQLGGYGAGLPAGNSGAAAVNAGKVTVEVMGVNGKNLPG